MLDDATSEIHYAQLVDAESTRTVMTALREVVEAKGVFCSPYSDRAGHFFVTPKRGERVDMSRPTQVARALQELDVRMIAAIHRKRVDAWNAATVIGTTRFSWATACSNCSKHADATLWPGKR